MTSTFVALDRPPSIVHSSTMTGLDAVVVEVRGSALPVTRSAPPMIHFRLPGTPAEESAARTRHRRAALAGLVVRVRSALADVRVRSALADADVAVSADVLLEVSPIPTSTSQLDLAVAVAVLAVSGGVPTSSDLLVLGELGPDGRVSPVRGVLAAAQAARAAGLRGVVVPAASAWEAALVEGLAVYAVADLAEALAALRGQHPSGSTGDPMTAIPGLPDFADVRGQSAVVDAIARAMAQGAGLLLSGPPGTGKARLALRVSTLLPAMTRDEYLQVVRAYSAAAMTTSLPAAGSRPCRAPHHTISTRALVGEVGPSRRPGELQLAGHGVLYLDDLAEFGSDSIAALADALRSMSPASRPRLVASATPCPCGWLGSGVRDCNCVAEAIQLHHRHVQDAARLLDVRATVEVPARDPRDPRDDAPGPSSAELRARVWRITRQGDVVALDAVVASYLRDHPAASSAEVLDHAQAIFLPWPSMTEDVTRIPASRELTFDEFQQAAPLIADAFDSICLMDDQYLIARGVIEHPRPALHVSTCWTYVRIDEGWRAVGDWSEVWEYRDAKWFCTEEPARRAVTRDDVFEAPVL